MYSQGTQIRFEYSGKDYIADIAGQETTVRRGENVLFCISSEVINENQLKMMVEAYWNGYQDGATDWRKSASKEW